MHIIIEVRIHCSFISSLELVSLRLGLLLLLLEQDGLDSLLLFSEVFFLELEHVNRCQIEIERGVFFHFFNLCFGCSLDLMVLGFSFSYELLNVYLSC